MTTKPLLEFSTLEPERPLIRIDGADYHLAILSDFGLQAQSRIARLMAEGAELEQEVSAIPPPEPTGNADADAALMALSAIPEAAADRTMALLDEVIDMILLAPPEVRARLNEVQKRLVVEAFTPTVAAATPTGTKGRKGQPSQRRRSTSESS
jgi:hypothetical protein